MPQVNDVPVSVNCDGFYYSNIRQDGTNIQMHAVDGSLYVRMPATGKKPASLYKFDQNGVSQLEDIFVSYPTKSLWNDIFVGFADRYMYIIRYPAKDSEEDYPKEADLVCYDLVTGVSEVLVSTQKAAYLDTKFDRNGCFYVSTKEASVDSEERYYVIQQKNLSSDTVTDPDAQTGAISEVLLKYNQVEPMFSENQLDEVIASATKLEPSSRECVLYPCKDSWLIHRSDSPEPLLLVASDGSVTKLLAYECMSLISCINCHGDYAYFSFRRYEKWDDKMGYSLVPYENDSISGTYRINLTDFSTEKISDNYYKGIFVFDEESIFVCDLNKGVYQLDPDGNLLATLVSPGE